MNGFMDGGIEKHGDKDGRIVGGRRGGLRWEEYYDGIWRRGWDVEKKKGQERHGKQIYGVIEE